MADPIYKIENLCDWELSFFQELDRNRNTALNNARSYLESEAYKSWLSEHIAYDQKVIDDAFRVIEIKSGFGDAVKDSDIMNVLHIIPPSPVGYCISYKWMRIYKTELNNATPTINKISSFDHCININDHIRKNEVKEMLHDLIDNKNGKWVALVIRCCIEDGLIKRPSYEDVITEFGNVIGRSNYKKYLSITTTPEEKITNEMRSIRKRIGELLG